MLAEEGCASFLMELRARGESQGERIGLGYEEVLDLLAGVAHVQSRQAYVGVPVVAFGLSLGGARSINAAGLTLALRLRRGRRVGLHARRRALALALQGVRRITYGTRRPARYKVPT